MINIQIDTNNLIAVMQNCNLGCGSFDKPIKADSFASTPCITKIPENEKTIKFSLTNNGSGPTPKLACILLDNVGKNDVTLPDTAFNKIYDEVFNCSASNIEVSNRQLCITAINDTNCAIHINTETQGELVNSFFSFTVMFNLAINGITYCFSVDPYLDVPSKRPSI